MTFIYPGKKTTDQGEYMSGPWARPDELDFIREKISEGYSYTETARMIKRTPSFVRNWALKMNVHSGTKEAPKLIDLTLIEAILCSNIPKEAKIKAIGALL